MLRDCRLARDCHCMRCVDVLRFFRLAFAGRQLSRWNGALDATGVKFQLVPTCLPVVAHSVPFEMHANSVKWREILCFAGCIDIRIEFGTAVA